VRLPCTPDTQGNALGYEQVGLTGRSLSERVNCDIIAIENECLTALANFQAGQAYGDKGGKGI
jgi:hypothetical protein